MKLVLVPVPPKDTPMGVPFQVPVATTPEVFIEKLSLKLAKPLKNKDEAVEVPSLALP